jgi:zinc transporter ZupT
MVEFLSGAVTFAYLLAGVYFVRFWRRTSDRFFLSFAAAFFLLALNQLVVSILEAADERGNYAYILRVVGFVLILFAIVDKNKSPSRKTVTGSNRRTL